MTDERAGGADATDVSTETIRLRVDGDDVATIVCRPVGRQPSGGVVLGAEATGVNTFIKTVGTRLAQAGYLAAIPDYYHGSGPDDPDRLNDWEHVPEIQRHIHDLDFRRGAHDMVTAIDHLRRHEGVQQIATWGYCTGGTLSMMAACLDPHVDAAVLFYPSQPTFEALTAKCPQHAVDLIWQLRCPVLLLVGDEDPIWPSQVVKDVVARFDTWSIPNEVRVYKGAGHVFAGHFGDSYRPEADADSWQRSVSFLQHHLLGDRKEEPR